MHQFSDNFIEQWNHIISEVEQTNIPVGCINKMIILLKGNKRKTINVGKLRDQGLDTDEIETVLTRNLATYGDEVKDINFVIDARIVADIIQPETDKLLENLK